MKGSDIINHTSREPFVAQIQDHFRSSIRRNDLHPGQKLPSIRQLSETCNVSIGIVKQALSTLTTEGYLRSHPGQGVFVCETRLATQNIALVLPSLDNEQMPKIIRGVKQALNAQSARLIVQAADFDFDQEIDLLTQLDTTTIAGAIIYPPPLNSYIEPLNELKRRGMPFVLVDTFFESLDVDVAASDRVAMGHLAIECLIEQGHRKIGIVDQDADAISIQQLRQGIDKALQKIGINFADLPRTWATSHNLDGDNPWAQGQAAAKELLKDHPNLTAIVGINDNISMGAFCAAKASGRRVPDDISVVSIGDLSAFRITTPNITAVDQDHQQMGLLAGKRLLELLEDSHQYKEEPQHISVAPTLIRRASVKKQTTSEAGAVSHQTSPTENIKSTAHEVSLPQPLACAAT